MTGDARSKSQLVAPPEDKPAQPEVVKAYELALSGVDDTAGPLWLLISKAKDLLGLFNNLTAFTKWYNATPGTEQQLEVNHPRLQIHREFDDLHYASSNNGIVGIIENQSLDDLVLAEWHSWYGWGEKVRLPAKI